MKNSNSKQILKIHTSNCNVSHSRKACVDFCTRAWSRVASWILNKITVQHCVYISTCVSVCLTHPCTVRVDFATGESLTDPPSQLNELFLFYSSPLVLSTVCCCCFSSCCLYSPLLVVPENTATVLHGRLANLIFFLLDHSPRRCQVEQWFFLLQCAFDRLVRGSDCIPKGVFWFKLDKYPDCFYTYITERNEYRDIWNFFDRNNSYQTYLYVYNSAFLYIILRFLTCLNSDSSLTLNTPTSHSHTHSNMSR